MQKKVSRERWKVFENVFDEFTLRTLFKLSGQHHFSELESPLFIGKESNVFTAKADNEKGRIIVKIYRIEACDFNKMYDYIKADPRYGHLKKQKRKIIFSWTQREFRNLSIARSAGVSVPLPITFMNNVLLEEFIGDSEVAIRIKDDIPKKPKDFFKKVIENMKKLHKIGLVHGDLSEYNILNFHEEPVFIDFSQSTQFDSQLGRELFDRDTKNIARFFNKLGVSCDESTIKGMILK
jgi:RIO kinase 1